MLVRRRGRIGRAGTFTLAQQIGRMFAAGEQGAWYDPSDLSMMYQDSTGITPVTAVEQPVGLLLDKRKSAALTAELTTNGEFATDTAWTKDAGWTITGGQAVATAAAGFAALTQVGNLAFSSRALVRVVMTATITAGSVYVQPSGAEAPSTIYTLPSSGTHSFVLRVGATNQALQILAGAGGFTGTIDSISVKEILGNHATQATSAARPVLSARINLITHTDDFSDWDLNNGATRAANAVTFVNSTSFVQFNISDVAPVGTPLAFSFIASCPTPQTIQMVLADVADGVPSHTQNISVTSTPTRFTFLQVMGAGASGGLAAQIAGASLVTAGSVVTFSEVQLEIGSARTRFQRIVTASDYDTAGFPHYLKFDGVDDSIGAAFTIAQPIDRISALLQETWVLPDQVYGGYTTDNIVLYQTNASPELFLYAAGLGGLGALTIPLFTAAVATERFNGASSRFAKNNDAYTTGAVGAGAAPGGWTIGGAYYPGNCAQMRFYGGLEINRALTDAEIAVVRALQAVKAGVTL